MAKSSGLLDRSESGGGLPKMDVLPLGATAGMKRAAVPATPIAPTRDERASKREFHEIPVAAIDESPLPPRSCYSPDVIHDRAKSIRQDGQREAIHIRPNPDKPGRFIIMEGWTRVLAFRQYNLGDTILAEIHHDFSGEDATIEAAWFGFRCNEEREENSDIDRAIFYAAMLDEMRRKGLAPTVPQFAAAANINRAIMSYLLAIAALPAELVDLMKTAHKRFTYSFAYEVHLAYAGTGRIDAARRLIEIILSRENVTVKQVQRERAALCSPATRNRRQVLMQFRPSDTSYIKAYEKKIEMVIDDISPERRDRLYEKIEDLVKKEMLGDGAAP